MSFFNDFLKNVEIDDVKNEIIVSAVVGNKLMILGNMKVIELNENEIVLSDKKYIYKIIGKGLILSSMAKGELNIKGDVSGFLRCENEWWNQS